MPSAIPPAADAPPSRDVLDLLVRLSRPGARLTGTAGGGVVTNPLRRGDKITRTPVSADLLQTARAGGFLLSAPGACEVLSPVGRAAVRAALMAQPAGPDGRQRGARPSRSQRPRPAQRLTLVEHLGQRRNAQGDPLLSRVQVDAALRLAQDFAFAQMQPRVTARWSADAVSERRRRGAPGAGVDLAAATDAAQQRVRAALAALGGALADVALEVCCFERGLETLEAARHWSRGTGRVVLGIAMTKLAEHYGLVHVSPRTGPVRQWGDDSYRPISAARTSAPPEG